MAGQAIQTNDMPRALPVPGNGTWLPEPEHDHLEGESTVRNCTFLGIDFGTAATVVNSMLPGGDGASLSVRPLVVSQSSAHGGFIRGALDNRVLSCRQDTFIFSQDACNLPARLARRLDSEPEYAAAWALYGRKYEC